MSRRFLKWSVFILAFTFSSAFNVDGGVFKRKRFHEDWKVASSNSRINLWEMMKDPVSCRAQSWDFYKLNLLQFRGEKGADILKESLINNRDLLQSTSTPASVHIVVDVGARIGDNHKFLRAITPPKALYLGFEPNPVNWLRLNKTLEGLQQSKFFPYAVSREQGTASFTFVHANEAGNPHGHLSKDDHPGATKVPVTTLDTVFEYYANYELDFLKIDTEGYDVTVLQGARLVLPHTRMIIFESNMLMKAATGGPGSSLLEAQAFLKEFGFEVFQVGTRILVPFSGNFYNPEVDDPSFMSYHNCFAIRPSDPLFRSIIEERLLNPSCTFR